MTQGLLNTIMEVLGGAASGSCKGSAIIRRGGDEISTHGLVLNRATCYSCIGVKRHRQALVSHNLQPIICGVARTC